MIRIAPTKVPNIITRQVTEGIKKLVAQAEPEFIEVRRHADTVPNQCALNVKKLVDREGGEIEFGWLIAVWPKVLVEFIAHAIYSSPCGERYCITPDQDGCQRKLFVSDNKLDFDFRDPEARMPTRMIASNSDPDITTLIAHEDREFEIKCKYPRGSHQIVIEGADALELQNLQENKIELIRRIFLRTKRPSEKCVCDSGRKFHKCCMPKMLTVGPYKSW